jgi:histone H3/H4
MSDPTDTTEAEATTAAVATDTTQAVATTTVATATPTDKAQSQSQSQSQLTPPPSAVEFEPPLACVRRILKNSLPSSTNVGKDASAAFARACGIFIIYLTACSNDFAREHKRQTITANDVLAAIKVSAASTLPV